MRVCIVGCGNQGTGGAALLVREPDMEEIAFVDISAEQASRAAALVRSVAQGDRPRLAAKVSESADARGLAALISGYDVVLNASIPALNIPLMEACLQAGAHYLDLYAYDDTSSGVAEDETIGAQLRLDQRFASAGLLALPGQGIGPGIADIALKRLTDRFEVVESIINRAVDWFDSDELLAPCNPQICMEQWLGVPGVACTRDGRVVSCDLVKTAERYRFPAPIGEQLILSTTHHGADGQPVEGPVVENKFANLSGGLDMKDILLTAVARQTAKHKASDNMLALFGSSLTPTSQVNIGRAHEEGRIRDSAMAVTIEVTGRRQGRRERYTWVMMAALEDSLPLMPWAAPSVLATIAEPVVLILMLGRDQLPERGVRQATDLACGDLLLREIERWGVRVSEETAVVAE